MIKRDYGFFIPNLFFDEWQRISNNPPIDVNADAYKPTNNKLYCNNAMKSETGDYCIPYLLNLSWDIKEGNTNLSILNFPNLGETATITVSNTDPEKVFPRKYSDEYNDFGIILSGNLRFVNVPESKVLRHGNSIYYQNLTENINSFYLNATIRAVNEGPSTIQVNGRSYGDDILHFTISNMTTDGIPLQNFRGNDIFVTLNSDKQHYASPELVSISGQFSDYIGKWISYYSKRIPIDSENKFTLVEDGERFRGLKNDEQYLVLHDRSAGVLEQIKITYDFQS